MNPWFRRHAWTNHATGIFKEFRNIEDLQVYLNELSEKVISGAVPRP